jgi:hypothetical protein
MRREDHLRAVRYLIQLFDEDRTDLFQPLHDKTIVHDLVTHIDRCAVFFDGQPDDADGWSTSRAIRARRREQQKSQMAFGRDLRAAEPRFITSIIARSFFRASLQGYSPARPG